MKLLFTNVFLSLLVASIQARPRYIAIPLEDVQLVQMPAAGLSHRFKDFPTLTRLPRRAVANPDPAPAPAPDREKQEMNESTRRRERQAHGLGRSRHNNYVDFGAHTGHHGSFGWYADFPAHKAK